jgi:HAMP domain-containing protein
MMSWIGVRPRVFGGFALVLSFLVLLAGFATVQVERIGGTVNELVASAAGDAGMSQARAALLGANSAVEKFIRTWNVGDKDAAAKAIDVVGKLADQVDQQFGKLPAIAEGIGPVKTALETYRSSFTAAAEAADRLRAATTKTDAQGAAAGLNVGGIQVALANRSDDAERLVNPMRLAGVVDALRITVMRYGASLSTGDADDAKQALSYVQMAIADTEAEIAEAGDAKLKTLVAALKTAIAADAAALDEVIKVAGDLRSRQAELKKASAAIDDQVNKINAKLGTMRAEQGDKTAAAVDQTKQTVIATAAGALLLGAVLAWLIGASVSGPIRSMTDRMQSLAAGELDEPIPGGESRDERPHGARRRGVPRKRTGGSPHGARGHGAARHHRGRSCPHDVGFGRPVRARHAGGHCRCRRPCRRDGSQRRGVGKSRRARSRARRSRRDPRRAGVDERADGCLRHPATRGFDP